MLFAMTDLGKKSNQFLFSQMEQKLKWRQFIHILSLSCLITSFNIFAIHKTPLRLCRARENENQLTGYTSIAQFTTK